MEEIEKKICIDDLITSHFFMRRAIELLEKDQDIPLANEIILCKSRINEIIQELRIKEKI